MEIISRSEARNRGLSQYFTNLPCKNGHVAYRYTQSGTCSGCIRSYSTPSPEFVEQRQNMNKARANMETMVSFRSRVFSEDFAFFRSLVLAAALEHEPLITTRDIFNGGKGSSSMENSAVYIFNCFAEDMEHLRMMAVEMFNAKCRIDTTAHRARIQAELDGKAVTDET